jgi:hypothetical protein
MSDEAPKTIHEKLDELHALVTTVADHVIRLDQNVLVLAGRLDAIEPEVSQTKSSVATVETALVHVAKDVHDMRDRVLEQDDRLGRRLRVLENGHTNGKSNGHG